jgi:hypothetical protein
MALKVPPPISAIRKVKSLQLKPYLNQVSVATLFGLVEVGLF